jgi:signal transduction histidine kinase/CheY-like chemotaxis protein
MGGGSDARIDKPLGFVVVAMSRANLEQSRKRMLLAGLGIVVVGLAGTLVLAWAWGRGITRPVRALSGTVAELERGNLQARVDPTSGGELLMLQTGFNRMADALQVHQSELERRIRAATADLASKKDEAERANREKSAFLAAVSHDLRQPMHAVGLFAATLRDRVRTPEQLELVQRIEDSLSALHGMFDALLNISRLDAGAVEAHVQPCHLKDLLQRVWQDFQPVAEQKKLYLRVRVCDGWVMSDPMLLGRMLNNLISNAIRYTERGGVLLGCRRRGGQWLIEVWDTGVGIAEDHLPHIFDEYFQVGNAERNRARGVGLGLAIVQKIGGLLGHPIEVRSRPGRGTVFRISVPAGEARSEDRRTVERSTGQFAGEPVLVIEDDQAALEAMATLLASWGLKPISANNLEQARKALQRCGAIPEAILCDYRLPQSSGIAVIRTLIGELGREIPALLITGDTAEESISEMKASGLPILHKPVRPAKLRAVLSAQLQT